MSKKLPLLFTVAAIAGITNGCSRLDNSSFSPDFPQIYSAPQNEDPITIQVKLDAPPFLSEQPSELSGIALMDDGKIVKYQTLKAGSSFTATTTIYESKWVKLESHSTTGAEAQTILKLASQGGFAKEFRTLRDRYSIIGLIDVR
jgi:hypothetical protein